jgi:acyl-CoA thioesterase YciA
MSKERHLAIRVILLPKDTNALGTIFGGVILSQIDLAAAEECRRHTRQRVATVAMKEVVFHEPVYVGDVVSFYTTLLRVGTTSLTVKVEVDAARARGPDKVVRVTEAEVVYVALGQNGKKTAVFIEPSDSLEPT